MAKEIHDLRREKNCDHSILSLLWQRIYGLAPGYEDLYDHQILKNDPAFQTVVEQESELVSASTLRCLKNSADMQTALGLHRVILVEGIRRLALNGTELS